MPLRIRWFLRQSKTKGNLAASEHPAMDKNPLAGLLLPQASVRPNRPDGKQQVQRPLQSRVLFDER